MNYELWVKSEANRGASVRKQPPITYYLTIRHCKGRQTPAPARHEERRAGAFV